MCIRDRSGTVDVGRGCVDPTLIIKSPTTAAAEMVGNANNPRKMIVRLRVQGADGSSVAGLLASDFTVQLRLAGGGPLLPATIINSAYVQDDYWLLVRPPKNTDGAQNGQFYDLIVNLGPQSDTENSAVLYVKRTQDVVIVLDRSGSMATANKIQAARNAANLFVNELAGDDQAGYVAFDTDADLREPLAPLAGGHRQDIEDAIAAEVPLDFTSIGDGMRTAAEHLGDLPGQQLGLIEAAPGRPAAAGGGPGDDVHLREPGPGDHLTGQHGCRGPAVAVLQPNDQLPADAVEGQRSPDDDPVGPVMRRDRWHGDQGEPAPPAQRRTGGLAGNARG